MFSTTTCWPSTSDRRAARMRPTVSEALPAANGTTNVIGRVGQFWVGRVCAIADEDASAIVRAAIERRRLKKCSMVGPRGSRSGCWSAQGQERCQGGKAIFPAMRETRLEPALLRRTVKPTSYLRPADVA